jgi:hypothetical protein
MGIRKAYTVYNGIQADYHSISDFTLDPVTGVCHVYLGAQRDVESAKIRLVPVINREYDVTGIQQGGNILADIYVKLMALPDLSDGVEF